MGLGSGLGHLSRHPPAAFLTKISATIAYPTTTLQMFDHLTSDALRDMSENQILYTANRLKQTIDSATAALALLQKELSQRVDNLDLSPRFTFQGWVYSRQEGRKTWHYPDNVYELEEKLKLAQSEAKADGSATFITGESFWRIAPEKTKHDKA